MFSGNEFKSTHSRIPSSTATRTGSAEARRAPAPGGVATGGDPATSSSSRTSADLFQGFGENAAVGRSRNGAPLTGSAVARPIIGGGGDYVSFPFYGPWGNYYPWYGGFGWNFGFVAYNPWYYGATRWFWGPYGMWYDPYMYWDPFYYGGGYSGGGGGSGYDEGKLKDPKKTTGSVRIKANPGTASVYIDGALAGKVEEFSGLNDHLEIEGGRHTIEIRAEGYVTKSEEINVKVDTTQTVRINLKKKK
jgi:hypothetical protein